MKLTQERFMSVIAYLSAYYTAFKFDVEDGGKPSMQFKVWYDVFKGFDEEMVVSAVQGYCKANVYPPQSPTNILEYMKQALIKNELQPFEAWELLLATMREEAYNFSKVKNRLKMHKTLLKVFEVFQERFVGLRLDDIPYLRKDFIQAYQQALTAYIDIRVNRDNLIETKQHERIGTDGEKNVK